MAHVSVLSIGTSVDSLCSDMSEDACTTLKTLMPDMCSDSCIADICRRTCNICREYFLIIQ